jgi:Rod binding domain-containing protein
MESFVPGIDPLLAIGSSINVRKAVSKENAQQQFASIFMAQIMKEIFKGQSEMFGEEGSSGLFSESLYNDIFLSKISADMASSKSLGFERIFQTNK